MTKEKKYPDWVYILKSAIYLTLIGYNQDNGYMIACKDRQDMEDAIVEKFLAKIEQFPPDALHAQEFAEWIRKQGWRTSHIKVGFWFRWSSSTRQEYATESELYPLFIESQKQKA